MASKPIRKSARPVELSKDQLAEYREAFTYFDTDQDGKINPVQFSHVRPAWLAMVAAGAPSCSRTVVGLCRVCVYRCCTVCRRVRDATS